MTIRDHMSSLFNKIELRRFRGGILKSRTLLILDDSEWDMEATQAIAEEMGWVSKRIIACCSVDDAINALDENVVDFAILDYHLGGAHTCVPVLNHITSAYPGVVAFVLTGAGADDSVVRACRDAGARLVISKRLSNNDACLTLASLMTVMDDCCG